MLDLLVYLDEGLIRNLNSLVVDGYIDIRTFKTTCDTSFGGNVDITNKEAKSFDFKKQKDKVLGYKSRHKSCEDHYQNGDDKHLGFEGRDFRRVEHEIKKINTIFTFHNELISNMYNTQNMKRIDYDINKSDSAKEGDYIEINGIVKDTSISLYIDVLIDVIDCYGADFLNSFLDENELKSLNFNIISNLLKGLKKIITANGTHDLIIQTKDASLVVSVNENNFLNNQWSMFNLVHCSCKIFGKVMMIKENDEKCVSLLRKSSQEEYYDRVFSSIAPYLEKLEKNNIIIPKKPECNIKGKMMMIFPMSICI